MDKPKSTQSELEVVRYAKGTPGYQDVSTYDVRRYQGPANEYKQTVMANAYRRLLGSVTGKRILDVGCGTGRGIIQFAREAAFAAGSDASLDMLTVAAQRAAGGDKLALVNAYTQHLPFRDGEFDVVTALNFLHLFSLRTQRQMIDELLRVVKPGGFLVLEFDNALHGLLVGLYKRWSGRERGSLPGEIKSLIAQRGRVVKIHGAVFPVVWRAFSRLPNLFVHVEKLALMTPFNHLAHRVYYKVVKLA